MKVMNEDLLKCLHTENYLKFDFLVSHEHHYEFRDDSFSELKVLRRRLEAKDFTLSKQHKNFMHIFIKWIASLFTIIKLETASILLNCSIDEFIQICKELNWEISNGFATVKCKELEANFDLLEKIFKSQ